MDHVIGICKDCAFWERIRNFEVERTFANPGCPKERRVIQYMHEFHSQWDVMIAELPPSKFGECSCPKIAENIGPEYDGKTPYAGTEANDELSMISTYGDSEATCQTGENFGCIHFKPKA